MIRHIQNGNASRYKFLCLKKVFEDMEWWFHCIFFLFYFYFYAVLGGTHGFNSFLLGCLWCKLSFTGWGMFLMLFHAHALDLMKDCSFHSHVFDAIKVIPVSHWLEMFILEPIDEDSLFFELDIQVICALDHSQIQFDGCLLYFFVFCFLLALS